MNVKMNDNEYTTYGFVIKNKSIVIPSKFNLLNLLFQKYLLMMHKNENTKALVAAIGIFIINIYGRIIKNTIKCAYLFFTFNFSNTLLSKSMIILIWNPEIVNKWIIEIFLILFTTISFFEFLVPNKINGTYLE